MAEQQRIVKWTVGAPDSRRRMTSNPIKLYNTTYEASYGRFIFPRNSGTQSLLNFKPALYRPSFSHTGKPSLRHLLLDSFTSQTKRDYRPRDGGLCQMRTFPKIDMSFVPHHPVTTASQSHLTVGQRGECGFTEGADLHLMTFQENKSNMVGLRPTGKSVMKTDFLPPSQLRGVEKFHGISNRVFQESGFTHD
ncbi:uncharacterized protein ppp1r32 [Thalassophryne amazonica]|uniref:uncharacterized protein ppp1r32 n=1 Tax=Thalassophryne amazonica TaxID=390379 RepID=UPI001470AF6E|nr:uncharacterized protein ppp1r32 [Thalassophryne amazonica]